MWRDVDLSFGRWGPVGQQLRWVTMLTRTGRNLLFRLGQLGALAVMAVLGLWDISTGLAGAGSA